MTRYLRTRGFTAVSNVEVWNVCGVGVCADVLRFSLGLSVKCRGVECLCVSHIVRWTTPKLVLLCTGLV